MRCKIGIHQWGKWRFGNGYIDVSYGLRVPSTDLVRVCGRCGVVKVKSKYALDPATAKRMYSAVDE